MPASHKLIALQLPPGMARAATPYDTTNRWYDLNLMRWVAGSLRPIGGWERMTPAPFSAPARKLFSWRSNEADRSLMIGTDHQLIVDKGGAGTYVDITPSGFVLPVASNTGGYSTGPFGMDFYGTPRDPAVTTGAYSNFAHWSMDNWGEDVLVTANTDGRIWHFVHDDLTPLPPVLVAGTKPVGSPQAPPNSISSLIVTAERHVMAIGGAIGGTYYPYRIYWSSREDMTDWDFASITNSAGFLDLQATSPLMTAVHVREGILVFSHTEVFLISYVGGPYYYGATKIGEMKMMNPYGIATFMGGAFWATDRGFHLYTAGYVSPLNCEFFDDVVAEVDETWGPLRVTAAWNGIYNEVWWSYPTHDNSENDKYVIFHLNEGWFAWGYIGRSAMLPAGTWQQPIMGGTNGHLYLHERGWSAAGEPILFDRYVETGALGLADGTNIVEVHQALIAASLPGTWRIEFFSRFTPHGAEKHYGPYSERPDGYTDTRVSGREARVRLTCAVDANVALGKTRLAVRAAGTR